MSASCLFLQGLAITFASDENDAKILNDVQDRFDVNISLLPDEIDLSSYSKFHLFRLHHYVSSSVKRGKIFFRVCCKRSFRKFEEPTRVLPPEYLTNILQKLDFCVGQLDKKVEVCPFSCSVLGDYKHLWLNS